MKNDKKLKAIFHPFCSHIFWSCYGMHKPTHNQHNNAFLLAHRTLHLNTHNFLSGLNQFQSILASFVLHFDFCVCSEFRCTQFKAHVWHSDKWSCFKMFTSTINKIPNSKNETDSTTCRHENSELMWWRERKRELFELMVKPRWWSIVDWMYVSVAHNRVTVRIDFIFETDRRLTCNKCVFTSQAKPTCAHSSFLASETFDCWTFHWKSWCVMAYNLLKRWNMICTFILQSRISRMCRTFNIALAVIIANRLIDSLLSVSFPFDLLDDFQFCPIRSVLF